MEEKMEDVEEKMEDIEEKMEDMEEKMDSVIVVHGNNYNADTMNNTTNIDNTTNNTYIMSFGNEDLSLLYSEDIVSYMERYIPGLVSLIRYIHFNDKLPMYQNMKSTDKNSDTVEIKDDNGWKIAKKEETYLKTIHNKMKYLQDKYPVNEHQKNEKYKFSVDADKNIKKFSKLKLGSKEAKIINDGIDILLRSRNTI